MPILRQPLYHSLTKSFGVGFHHTNKINTTGVVCLHCFLWQEPTVEQEIMSRLTFQVPLLHPLIYLHQVLGKGGHGSQLQTITAWINPLLLLLDLKEDYGSCSRSGNRIELHPKRFHIAEDIRQVRQAPLWCCAKSYCTHGLIPDIVNPSINNLALHNTNHFCQYLLN